MKALALDTAISCITVAAKNGDATASLTLDIGMKQSERLLPAVDYVMNQLDLNASDLDYGVLTGGPGSFTGLRLGFAALKAIELRAGIPLYGINSLDCYAHPFVKNGGLVLSVIDARKDKFYAKAWLCGKEVIPCDDWELSALAERLECVLEKRAADGGGKDSTGAKDCADAARATGVGIAGAAEILVCGLEAPVFTEACKKSGLLKDFALKNTNGRVIGIDSLFLLAEEKIARGEPPLADYDGPEYFRASEAEQKAATEKK